MPAISIDNIFERLFGAKRRNPLKVAWGITFRVFDFFFPYAPLSVNFRFIDGGIEIAWQPRIRLEALTVVTYDKFRRKHIHREFGTFRAFAVHMWDAFVTRKCAKEAYVIDPIRNFMLHPCRGVIAFDDVHTQESSNQDSSTSHTVTGTSVYITSSAHGNNDDSRYLSGAYNSVALTNLIENSNPSRCAQVWGLVNPATGAHNLTHHHKYANINGNTIMSFSGVNQVTPTGTTGGAGANSTSVSASVTSTAANSWLIDSCWTSTTGAITAGGSQTQKSQFDIQGSYAGGAGYQVTTTTGSYSNSYSWSGTRQSAIAILEILVVAGRKRRFSIS